MSRVALCILRWLGVALTLLALAACVQQLRLSDNSALPARAPDALRLVTLNVHYIDLRAPAGPWSRKGWEARKGPLDAQIKALGADIIAFQEMESFAGGEGGGSNLTLDHLLAQNPEFAAAAMGDWRDFPSTQPIFYRKDRLRQTGQGWFFFSDTPEVIYSRTFNGSWPAFASWAEFETPEGRRLRVVNVHFEYRSRSNRRLSAQLVRDRLAPLIGAGEAVVLAGDLNVLHGAPVMQTLEAAGLNFPRVPGATYHLNRGLHLFGAIDHFGLSDAVSPVAGPFVMQQKAAEVWPSDHHPVVLDVTIR